MSGGRRPGVLALVCGVVFGCSEAAPGDRRGAVGADGPSQETMDRGMGPGSVDGIATWPRQDRLDGLRNMHRLYPTRTIPAGEAVYPLTEAPADFADFSFDYDGRTLDLEGFLEHNRVLGLLVLKDGAIVLERYREGHTPDTRWISYSVAKSVVSLLVGAAIREGVIADLETRVSEYVPALQGSAYDEVTLGHLMQMTSGIGWSEDYGDPDSEVRRTFQATRQELLNVLSESPRVAPPGERFNYSTGEARLVGAVLAEAIGGDLSGYLASRIWQPFGMESDALWMLTEPGGPENGGCCLAATLRDYGRIGLFALSGGRMPGGDRILPDGWMETSTTPSAAYPGYGYLWWLPDPESVSAIGIYGQMIWMDPAEQVVIVTHSLWGETSAHWGQAFAFTAAVRDALRASAPP